MSGLDAIFITHLHGDHCFGLFGLLGTLGMGMVRTRPLTIVGPIGIREMVVTVMRASESLLQYDLSFIELEGNQPCDLGTVVGGTLLVPSSRTFTLARDFTYAHLNRRSLIPSSQTSPLWPFRSTIVSSALGMSFPRRIAMALSTANAPDWPARGTSSSRSSKPDRM
jgi:ribonuclease BN (tRNA processing enzyme)